MAPRVTERINVGKYLHPTVSVKNYVSLREGCFQVMRRVALQRIIRYVLASNIQYFHCYSSRITKKCSTQKSPNRVYSALSAYVPCHKKLPTLYVVWSSLEIVSGYCYTLQCLLFGCYFIFIFIYSLLFLLC